MNFIHDWSQSYMKEYRLTWEEHHLNNEWFYSMRCKLTDKGKLYVPLINKSFNKQGEEIHD